MRTEGQLVEHGDLLSELKRVQKGKFGGFERQLTTPNTLLITGSGELILSSQGIDFPLI
jgi:hypothetical protein